MRVSEAIIKADRMRSNAVPDPDKRAWLLQLETEIAECMKKPVPVWGEDEDPELLAPDPFTQFYVVYLAAWIDYYQEEMDLYQIDTIMANNMISNFKSWYTRNHKSEDNNIPKIKGVWI